MNIILVSGPFAKVRTITLGRRHIAALVLGAAMGILVIATAINFVMLRFAPALPFLQDHVLSMQQNQQHENESYMRDNLNAMAQRLGQMQAQLLRLDTMGERLAAMAGVTTLYAATTTPATAAARSLRRDVNDIAFTFPSRYPCTPPCSTSPILVPRA